MLGAFRHFRQGLILAAATERIATGQSRRPLPSAMFATFFPLILLARCGYVFKFIQPLFNFLQRRIVTRFA